ncbi:MAG: hypothetical protein J5620_01900 [Alphaproteobacteria bacterium]|nr:hypothetical protein [Alphaproteobacteria bacterium]
MKDFGKDVSECLLRLHHALAKKIDWHQMKLNEEYRSCFTAVVFLHSVALNPFEYCAPGKDFDTNMKELSFDVPRFYSLFTLDQKIAQCVYDIMICAHDYLCYGDDKLDKPALAMVYKYHSKQEAVDAMRLFKRDAIQRTGGMIPYVARKLYKTVFSRTR